MCLKMIAVLALSCVILVQLTQVNAKSNSFDLLESLKFFKDVAPGDTKITTGDNNEVESLEFIKGIAESVRLTTYNTSAAISSDKTEICYEYVGCFSLTSGIMRHTKKLPQPIEKIAPRFIINNGAAEITVTIDNMKKEVLQPFFGQLQDLTVIAHGYGGKGTNSWILAIQNNILNVRKGSIIRVHWANGATKGLFDAYAQAAANSELMGRLTAVFIKKLIKLFPASVVPEKTHYVGHSLGAHMGGFMSRWFREELKEQKIGRLTALDAAGPLFEDYNVFPDKNDVNFLDAIHTCGGNSIVKGKLGTNKPFGHVDFYPNGGSSQPGCKPSVLGVQCNHKRASLYFIESITSGNCQFESDTCHNSLEDILKSRCSPTGLNGRMGFYSIDARGRENQYLTTNKVSPFCQK